jgi:hypothetical protein
MNRCYHFRAIGSSSAPSTSLSCCSPLTQLIRCYTLMVRRFSPKPYCLHLRDHQMNRCSSLGASLSCSNWVTGYPDGALQWTVGSSDASDFVASPLQFIRRIYKMDRRFIKWCQLIPASAQCTKCSDARF